MPNSKEIHLDYVPLKDLYAAYLAETTGHVEYKQWKAIWDNLFPHVKVRVYKQVTGKCFTCADLSSLRSKFTHPDLKKIVTNLHEMHRQTYIGEKILFYERRM